MRIHQFRVTCDVCGGPAYGTIRTAGAAWDPRYFITHTDPAVCRDYLDTQRRKQRRLEQQNRELLLRLAPLVPMDIAAERAKLDALGRTISNLRSQLQETA